MLVLGIVSVVLLLVYIYLKPTPWENVTQSERLELVFKNKNKEYGAYQLRKKYNRNLTIILFSVMMFLSSGFILTMIKNEPKPVVKISYTDNKTINIEEPPKELEVIKKEETHKGSAPKISKSFLPPVVTDNDVVSDVPVNSDLDNTNINLSDNNGEGDDFNNYGDGVDDSGNNLTIDDNNVIKTDTILTFVDEEPIFPGGDYEMKKFISNNIVYPQDDIYLNIQGRVVVKFAVEKDGSISNISIIRSLSVNCDKSAIELIKKMPNWKPGKINGNPVRVWCTIPINFELH